MTQVLLPMLKKEGAAIVNLSSEGGFLGRPGQWVYDAIKAGLVSTTKTMAYEFVDYGIRVNAVAPGVDCYGDALWQARGSTSAEEGIGRNADNFLRYETSCTTRGGGFRYRFPAQ